MSAMLLCLVVMLTDSMIILLALTFNYRRLTILVLARQKPGLSLRVGRLRSPRWQKIQNPKNL
jgi:hypothetical protein